MYKDKKALVETLRKYKNHILWSMFKEAADTIEEQMRIIDALESDNDQLTAKIEELKSKKDSCPIETAAKPGHWIFITVDDSENDPIGFFKHRYECSVCGEWQTYGTTKYCPNCGAAMEVNKDDGEKEEG